MTAAEMDPKYNDGYSCLKSVLETEPVSPATSDVRVKRKFRTSLTVKNKLEVIEYASLNPSATQSKIASHFGIDRTTVSKVLKRKADILTYADQFSGSSELMYTSLMKKTTTPPPAQRNNNSKNNNDSSSGGKTSPRSSRSSRAGNSNDQNHKLRPLLPKNGAAAAANVAYDMDKVVDLSAKHNNNNNNSPNSKKACVSAAAIAATNRNLLQKLKTSKESLSGENGGMYSQELSAKCESWFMDQNLSPTQDKNNHDYVTSIRSFSKLLSMVPLSDGECYKILAGKHVRDACLLYARIACGNLPENERSISSNSYELLHKFLLEGMPNLDLDQFYCSGFKAFDAEDVKRLWVRYVQPKLQSIFKDECEKRRPALMDIPSLITPTDNHINLNSSGGLVELNSSNNRPLSTLHSPDYDSSQGSPFPGSPATDGNIVRGSRKRKMNSRPVKMIANDENNMSPFISYDEPMNFSMSDINQNSSFGSDSLSNNNKPYVFGGHVNSDIYQLDTKKRRTESDPTIIKNPALNGLGSDKNPFPVIEIKPEGCSDDENVQLTENSALSASKLAALSLKSFYNEHTYLKILEHRIANLEKRHQQDQITSLASTKTTESKSKISIDNLTHDCLDAIVNKCSEAVKNMINDLSNKVSNLEKTVIESSQHDIIAECKECSSMKSKVESLESKIELIQGRLEKVTHSQTSESNSENSKDAE